MVRRKRAARTSPEHKILDLNSCSGLQERWMAGRISYTIILMSPVLFCCSQANSSNPSKFSKRFLSEVFESCGRLLIK